MKLFELVEKLQEFDPESEVILRPFYSGTEVRVDDERVLVV